MRGKGQIVRARQTTDRRTSLYLKSVKYPLASCGSLSPCTEELPGGRIPPLEEGMGRCIGQRLEVPYFIL